MTDPTPDTLRDLVLRHLAAVETAPYAASRDAAYCAAAVAAGRMIAALDAGAPFPDAWQPFVQARINDAIPAHRRDAFRLGTELARNTIDVAHQAPSDNAPTEQRPERRMAETPDEWAARCYFHGYNVGHGAGERFAEYDARTVRELRADLDSTREQVIEETTERERLELELTARRAELEHLKTCRLADAQKIDRLTDERYALQQRLDAATFNAQDYHDALEAIDRLTTERDAARAEASRWEDAARRNGNAARTIAAERDASQQRNRTIHDETLAALTREAATLADDAATSTSLPTDPGTARAVRAAADRALRISRIGGEPATPYTQLCTMLAVGAARYSSNRKSATLAHRTATHLRTLAEQLAP